MRINKLQENVDNWIKEYGVRYFDIKTNTLLLNEEVGEFSRLVARIHGEQSFKITPTKDEADAMLADELADILWVTVCIANQLGINLEDAISKSIQKKTIRDKDRHKSNRNLNQ